MPLNTDLVYLGDRGMDDCVAAVTTSGAEYPHRKLRIKNINQLALVLGLLAEEDTIVSREQISSFCNVRRAAVDVLGTVHIAQPYCTVVLFAWHVAAFELRSCGCARKWLKITYCTTPQ